MVKEKRLGQLILAAMLVGYLLYAAVFIFQSSFVINGTRYFVLFDDAMISMQYARNFAHGQGLVWNAGGEHVEGYSNPLWVLVMAVFHLFPVPPPLMSLPDRKSTRLNSSHGYISYAVFCF